ncbi:MAG: hypothetical protein M3N49_08705, partial [Candidatus Eremiobacteraeota bacterium]|nr:hypothetical protein [Candidatus Eremiobacteraeota bacterium]
MIDEERALDGLTPLIARLAAAKHAASFRCAYWGGRAPAIATGMSLIGIALEEEGHARVLEALLGDAPGVSCAPEATVTWRRWPALADTSSQRAESWLRAMVRYAVGDAEVTAALHVL